MRVAVVVFPGTNCDHDALHVLGTQLKAEAHPVWHRDEDLQNPDLVVLPGGFSFGDYLRTGALAKLSPAMTAVRKHAEGGGKVLGICNGFQILCEAGLLPGALLENVGRQFLSRFVHIRVSSNKSFFTNGLSEGSVITCPIAHFQGNYFADSATLSELEKQGQVVFRYCSGDGEVDPANRASNVNGSLNAIAGICNREGNVVGLMPHPERATEKLIGAIGGTTGLAPFAASLGAALP
jgi:phosphoribosylformylglycinamidine synthase I